MTVGYLDSAGNDLLLPAVGRTLPCTGKASPPLGLPWAARGRSTVVKTTNNDHQAHGPTALDQQRPSSPKSPTRSRARGTTDSYSGARPSITASPSPQGANTCCTTFSSPTGSAISAKATTSQSTCSTASRTAADVVQATERIRWLAYRCRVSVLVFGCHGCGFRGEQNRARSQGVPPPRPVWRGLPRSMVNTTLLPVCSGVVKIAWAAAWPNAG